MKVNYATSFLTAFLTCFQVKHHTAFRHHLHRQTSSLSSITLYIVTLLRLRRRSFLEHTSPNHHNSSSSPANLPRSFSTASSNFAAASQLLAARPSISHRTMNETNQLSQMKQPTETMPARVEDEKLDANIQSLCQELQDIIFAFAYQIPPHVLLTDNYNPPTALQLNHELRERYALEYYGNTIFECKCEDGSELQQFIWNQGQHCFRAWARSLSDTHRLMIANVHITRPSDLYSTGNWFLTHTLMILNRRVSQAGLGHANVVLATIDEAGGISTND